MKAIVYTSKAGHTAEYAHLLGEETGGKVYALKDAAKNLPKGTEVLYLGWLMAGTVKGYKRAKKRFCVKALCGVGMASGDGQIGEIRKVNRLPADLPVFLLQGGFELDKLTGIYKFMMQTVKSTAGKGLSDKEERTPEEDEMLNLMLHGANLVSREKLEGVIHWYREEEKKEKA